MVENFVISLVYLESVKRRRARGLPRLMPLGRNIFPSGGIVSHIFCQKVKFYILHRLQIELSSKKPLLWLGF